MRRTLRAAYKPRDIASYAVGAHQNGQRLDTRSNSLWISFGASVLLDSSLLAPALRVGE